MASLEKLTETEKELQGLIEQKDDDYYLYYLLGWTQYNKMLFHQNEDRQKSIEYLDEAIKNCEKSISLKDDYSNAHALLGQLFGMKINFSDSPFAGMQYGSKAQMELDKALRIDKKNPMALTFLGLSKMYTPEIYGGSIETAISLFQQAIESDPKYYDAYVFLAQLLREKRNNYEAARQYLLKAIAIDPQRKWAKDELKKIDDSLKKNSSYKSN
ncbi:MAG: tetratricopeptide repeat protein [Acidobacteriota bacterium]|nr:tetratricopeptide repeat protein [Acidobacteriota bacterium]